MNVFVGFFLTFTFSIHPSDAKLDAVELLLHSFGSSATFLNPQATRCICLYTLDFDPSGSVLSALVRVRVSLPLTLLVWWRTLGNAVLNGAKKPLTILSWTWYYNYSGWVTVSL